MSVIAICGLPGSGKTLFATYLQLKFFKKQNNVLSRIKRKIKKEDVIFNNIFSNYPIRLKKKKKDPIFCNRVSLFDFNNIEKFPINSNVVLDEFQMYFDSLDYKNFPKNIRTIFQLHRHLGFNNIYILSQHPSRIVKQARVLISEFYEVTKSIRLPLGFMFFRYNIYYNFEDFGKPVNVKRSEVPYRFRKRFKIFRYKKVYDSYDTIYMRHLLDNAYDFDIVRYKDKSMNLQEINYTFNL
ncbi:MAG: zonular occludens toxin domain-containing protein [Bacilli bacterium]